MPFIERPKGETKFDVNGKMMIPSMQIPGFRTEVATESGVQNNILIHVMGGIGDYICCEPSIRYAIENFKDTEVSLATRCPEFFENLPVKKIYNLDNPNEALPNPLDFLMFQSVYSGDELSCQFLTHMFCHVVDYHSLCMFRVQLEPDKKDIRLFPSIENRELAAKYIKCDHDILIHPGRTWESRTFSKDWWDGVITHIIRMGKRPVIIGTETINKCGTVDVNPDGCLDLRGKLNLMESVAVTQRARVILTNDSAPLHMAASGDAWIGFLSTVKRPDYLLHFRRGEMGWRMQNLTTGGFWQEWDMRLTNPNPIDFSKGDPSKFLPAPIDVAVWGVSKLV